jgi:hypothetical protein
MIHKLILTIFLILAFVVPGWGATYYVDTTCTDTNPASGTVDGTAYDPATPACTGGSDSYYVTIADINAAAATLAPGDTISFRKGQTWREQLTIPESGTSGNVYTFNSFGSGADPTILGSVTCSAWSPAAGGSWTTVYTYTLNNDDTYGPTNDLNLRQVVGQFATAGTQIRFTLEANSGNDTIITAMKIGVQDSGDDFTGAPTAVTFSSNPGVTITAGQEVVSDAIAYVTNTSDTYMFSTWQDGDTYLRNSFVGGEAYTDHGATLADESSDVTVSGYTARAFTHHVNKIEVLAYITNVWECDDAVAVDIGNLIFDSEASVGIKEDLKAELGTQGEFWWDDPNDKIFLYSTSDPDVAYTTIEMAKKWSPSIISISNKDYITIDGLTIKYSGSHGIQANSGSSNLIIQNNTISYIGGAYIAGTTRYGNGIEIYTDADTSDVQILNNTVSQCYDEGITNQIDGVTADIDVADITVSGNTISTSGRGVASSFTDVTGTTTYTNVVYEKNTIQNLDTAWSVPGGSNPTNASGEGALLNAAAADTMTGCEFKENKIDTTPSGADPIGQGLRIVGGSWDVTRNWIENINNSGIRAYGDPTLDISYNIITDPNTKPCIFFSGDDSNANVTNVYNNVCFASDNQNIKLVQFGANGGFAVTNHVFKNNILLNTGTNTSELVYVSDDSSVTLDYNLYYRNSAGNLIRWSNTTTYTQANWATYQSASSQDANSPTPADPSFTTPGSDLTLQSGSPAINAGTNLGSAYDDALDPDSTWPSSVTTGDQDNFGRGWEIGAFYYPQGGGGAGGIGFFGFFRASLSGQPQTGTLRFGLSFGGEALTFGAGNYLYFTD